ncbi:class I SAM-dependent rRNA methyltransferase [bacterium]|nr:class I SAM-dependent rRNA methyltransferase [bacterium]
MTYPVVELKPGREKSLLARHPWVFSGAIAREPGGEPGDLVDVFSSRGEFLARGAYNPRSQIRVRVFTFNDEPVDVDFFARVIGDAARWKRALLPEDTNAYRVCFSEGDGLPGVIIDDYAGHVVLQLQTAGADRRREDIVSAIERELSPRVVYERSDSGFRLDEGLERQSGTLAGDAPDDIVPIRERGLHYFVDIQHGQKTGFYLDQRDARRLVERIAEGKSVLNTFSYTCGFGVAALVGGARRVVNVDGSGPALDIGRRNYEANKLAAGEDSFIEADVFDFLREDEETFDMIVLDPPAFSKSQASVPRALRGYKEIIMRGLLRVNPGGYVLAFSCSGHVDAGLFQKVIFGAALDVGASVQILSRLTHAIDHPINIYHPEGEYLCGYFLRVGRPGTRAPRYDD